MLRQSATHSRVEKAVGIMSTHENKYTRGERRELHTILGQETTSEADGIARALVSLPTGCVGPTLYRMTYVVGVLCERDGIHLLNYNHTFLAARTYYGGGSKAAYE
jgi:hypothetical protein